MTEAARLNEVLQEMAEAERKAPSAPIAAPLVQSALGQAWFCAGKDMAVSPATSSRRKMVTPLRVIGVNRNRGGFGRPLQALASGGETRQIR